jgi:hypothetical protein
VVRGVPHWLCFDACPTYACLPFVAARAKAMTPNAKLVVMVSAVLAGGGGVRHTGDHEKSLLPATVCSIYTE